MLSEKILSNPVIRLYKKYMLDSVVILKKSGPRELIRQRGRKFVMAVFCYYLIRDTIVYVLIPLYLARGLF